MKNSTAYKFFSLSPYKSIKYSTYFHVYDHLFKSFKNKKITFLEIGILDGGSLFMWRKYFGPKAKIIGIDLNPNAKKWEKDGFKIFIGNQGDRNFWNKVRSKVGKIDIVLDDGGHTYQQQIITSESLFEKINDGGLLVVEDTHTSYMKGFGPKKYSFINYVKKKIDLINFRFQKFKKKNYEQRIWSIEIFESIVAFRVHKKRNKVNSKMLDNKGVSDSAIDFRYHDNSEINHFKNFAKYFKFLKFLPFARSIHTLVLNYLFNRKFNAKKYFD